MKKKLLLIAPLSPPVTGQSLASDVLFDHWKDIYDVEVVNLSKASLKNGVNSFGRVVEVFKLFVSVLLRVYKADVIYFTIAESRFGIIKDLFIYSICFFKLKSMVIHLHGGAGMSKFMHRKYSLLKKANLFFIKRIGAIIVLGKTHEVIYSKYIPIKVLHSIPNFSSDDIFISEKKLAMKLKEKEPINILFLSNLIPGKGYLELLEAFKKLSLEERTQFQLNFAGAFQSEYDEKEFLASINGETNIRYHGIVRGEKKVQLFNAAHVFCLPTYYEYEGQPISILEAYASGCFVITTDHSGIRDVFSDSLNGFQVEAKSVDSLRVALSKLTFEKDILDSVAKTNVSYATNNYRLAKYLTSVTCLIEGASSINK